jgi:ribosomal protein L31
VKKDIHPKNNLVCFSDVSTGKKFYTHSTMKSKNTDNHNGVDHFWLSEMLLWTRTLHTRVRKDLLIQLVELRSFKANFPVKDNFFCKDNISLLLPIS